MRGINWKIGAWTPSEDDILFQWYESHGSRKVSEITGRTRTAVHNRAKYFGLRCSRVRNKDVQAVRLYLQSK